jgi:hypothetical protein
MSENTNTTTETATEATGVTESADKGGNSGNYTPPASQADLDRIIADRITREKAKYADYSDLKAKAAKFDEAEEASKTEIQKANEAREAAEKALAAKEAEALRLNVASKHGIPAEHLDLLVGSDEAELEAKALKIKSLTEKPAEEPRKGVIGPYVPPEGQTTSGSVTDPGHVFGEFLKTQLGG